MSLLLIARMFEISKCTSASPPEEPEWWQPQLPYPVAGRERLAP